METEKKKLLWNLSVFLLAAFPVKTMASPDAKEESPEGLIARLSAAGEEERLVIVHELGLLGATALDATRKARDSATSPELKEAFSRAASWQLASKVKPLLREGFESQLTYDGQFSVLKEEGPEVVEALFSLVNDAASEMAMRLSAARALADVVSSRDQKPGGPGEGQPVATSLLPRLRRLYHDILCPYVVKEQIGFLLAMLGDTHPVDSEISKYEKLTRSEDAAESMTSYLELANLYYKMRSYQKAVKCYDKIIPLYEDLYKAQKKARPTLGEKALTKLKQELALQYYNAACSNALYGDMEKSKRQIKKAVELDPMHYKNMQRDGDLLNLRRDPSFPELQKELGKLFEKESL